MIWSMLKPIPFVIVVQIRRKWKAVAEFEDIESAQKAYEAESIYKHRRLLNYGRIVFETKV